MKKIISIILSISLMLATFSISVNSNAVNTGLSLTLSKIIDDGRGTGIPYTGAPVKIQALFDSGNDGETDKFVKKSWFRTELLKIDDDLKTVYTENKDKEIIITPSAHWSENTYRAEYTKDITLNGTYVFCGWSSNTELPDYIESIDVTEVKVERPMAEISYNLVGDFSKEIIATAEISSIECAGDAEIKKFAFVKDYTLSPGSWPESLAQPYCNEQYDEILSGLYDTFVKASLEITAEDGKYPLRDTGSYLLFIEDTKGRYSCIATQMPILNTGDITPPKISYCVINEQMDTKDSTVGFYVNDDIGVAKVGYAVLSSHTNICEPLSAEDSFLLESTRNWFDGCEKTISSGENYVVCAVDTSGNTSYVMIDVYNITGSIPTPIPTPPPVQIIIVDPPEVDVESGVVAYGTKVKIGSWQIAYSINGSFFEYDFFPHTITITEDTTIVVKSWVDALMPNIEYVCPEATYKYTVDDATYPYPYIINDISLLSNLGEKLSAPPYNTGFIVDVSLKKVQERNEKDCLFVAVYDIDGALISLDYVKSNTPIDTECSFGFYISPQEETIGSVKAYVWNDFGSMEPLAESKEFKVRL